MTTQQINAANAAAPAGAYTQSLEVTGTTRRLYISGQPPVTADGSVPSSFGEEAKVVWQNILAQLDAADMSAEHLVKAMAPVRLWFQKCAIDWSLCDGRAAF